MIVPFRYRKLGKMGDENALSSFWTRQSSEIQSSHFVDGENVSGVTTNPATLQPVTPGDGMEVHVGRFANFPICSRTDGDFTFSQRCAICSFTVRDCAPTGGVFSAKLVHHFSILKTDGAAGHLQCGNTEVCTKG
jgi:hypothetical protein